MRYDPTIGIKANCVTDEKITYLVNALKADFTSQVLK